MTHYLVQGPVKSYLAAIIHAACVCSVVFCPAVAAAAEPDRLWAATGTGQEETDDWEYHPNPPNLKTADRTLENKGDFDGALAYYLSLWKAAPYGNGYLNKGVELDVSRIVNKAPNAFTIITGVCCNNPGLDIGPVLKACREAPTAMRYDILEKILRCQIDRNDFYPDQVGSTISELRTFYDGDKAIAEKMRGLVPELKEATLLFNHNNAAMDPAYILEKIAPQALVEVATVQIGIPVNFFTVDRGLRWLKEIANTTTIDKPVIDIMLHLLDFEFDFSMTADEFKAKRDFHGTMRDTMAKVLILHGDPQIYREKVIAIWDKHGIVGTMLDLLAYESSYFRISNLPLDRRLQWTEQLTDLFLAKASGEELEDAVHPHRILENLLYNIPVTKDVIESALVILKKTCSIPASVPEDEKVAINLAREKVEQVLGRKVDCSIKATQKSKRSTKKPAR